MKDAVLLIEDERAIADTVIYALEREGFRTCWGKTGAEGLTLLAQELPVLLILDIGLPDCNGLDLCRQIRNTSQLPIIFLSARNEEVDRILGLELGGDDYVSKPFSPRELIARVRSVLRRHRLPGPVTSTSTATSVSVPAYTVEAASGGVTSASIGPFVLEQEQLQISFAGQALELSLHEYRLLSLLLSRPKKVFTRGEILDLAWDEPAMITDRTVDAHIKSIRKKIRAIAPEADPIRTVRGVGYAMAVEHLGE